MSYDPENTAQFFDDYGLKEWNRLTRTPVDEINLYIHAYYLRQFIQPGMETLEIGPGPGRFTQILAELGARLLVADISSKQLDLNRHHAGKYGFAHAVREWRQLDICDMSALDDDCVDCVVAYGAPFGYVLDRRDQALRESLRVLKPGGLLLLSVSALWGSAHRALAGVLAIPVEQNKRVIATGDLTRETLPDRPGNYMHMFRAHELRDWLAAAGLEILVLSASGCLANCWDDDVQTIRDDEAVWQMLLDMELEASAQEECLGMGTHLIAVCRLSE